MTTTEHLRDMSIIRNHVAEGLEIVTVIAPGDLVGTNAVKVRGAWRTEVESSNGVAAWPGSDTDDTVYGCDVALAATIIGY